MAAAEPPISLERLRAAVRDEIERTSSHAVAKDVGMSAPALREFERGITSPRSSTRRKLISWYMRYLKRAKGTLKVDTADAALTLLLQHIPLPERDDAKREFYEWLERTTRQRSAPLPRWVREGRKRYGGGG